MEKSVKYWTYKGYRIFLMHDGGAYWYTVESKDGDFLANCDTFEECQKEVDAA